MKIKTVVNSLVKKTKKLQREVYDREKWFSFTFLVDEKAVNFVAFYDPTRPAVEFSVTKT